MKEIQEFWAELVTSGLAPDWSDVIASTGANKNRIWRLEDPNYNISTWIPFNLQWGAKSERIQLRSNGIDLVKLKWQKPTEQDVGKMCWFYDQDIKSVTLNKLLDLSHSFSDHSIPIFKMALMSYKTEWYNYCLLAIHGRLAPTIDDFEECYKC